jgi:hypothetical protein
MWENHSKCFFDSFTVNKNITKLIFNNKDELIQVVNSKPQSLKICDNANNIEIFSTPICEPIMLNTWQVKKKHVWKLYYVSPINPRSYQFLPIVHITIWRYGIQFSRLHDYIITKKNLLKKKSSFSITIVPWELQH